jgi:hypothetical protein
MAPIGSSMKISFFKSMLAILILFFGINILVLQLKSVKITVCRQVEFVAIDKSGKPMEGIEILQEWGEPIYSNNYSGEYSSDMKEKYLTNENGRVSIPERSYHSTKLRIVLVGISYFIKYLVNFDNNIWSTIKINGVLLYIEDRNNERHYNVIDKIIIGECNNSNLLLCYYDCNDGICEFHKGDPPGDLVRKLGLPAGI